MMFSLYFKEHYLRQRFTDEMMFKKYGALAKYIPRTLISACDIKLN